MPVVLYSFCFEGGVTARARKTDFELMECRFVRRVRRNGCRYSDVVKSTVVNEAS